ncbi:MAG: T9SS type A sorting domain-containing protein [Bacteroidota bacterium]
MNAYKRSFFATFSVLLVITGYAQHPIRAEYFKAFDVPEIYKGNTAPELPESVLNHHKPFYPDDWYDQGFVPSCGQASAVYNAYTYELNRLKDRAADSSTIMAPLYTYNFLNEGNGWYGASSFDSYEIAKSQGNATLADYGDPQAEIIDFEKVYYAKWMNGYDKYYHAMLNRIEDYFYLDVDDKESLEILRHYLNDHLEQSQHGGIPFFYCGNAFVTQEPDFLYDDSVLNHPNGACKVYRSFDGSATHSMTLTGYITNDSVDFNGDGLITDSVDINADGVVDFHDNERILWVIQNSYPPPDDLLLFKYDALVDLWDAKVFFPVPDDAYRPELTARIKMIHDQRNAIRIRAGIAENPEAERPEKIMDFPIFNFQGGNKPLTGVDTLENSSTLEFGLDISDVLKLAEAEREVRLFLVVENASHLEGHLETADILHYENTEPQVYPLIRTEQNLASGSTSLFNVKVPLESKPVDTCLKITTEKLLLDEVSDAKPLTIEATGGKKPYRFRLYRDDEYDIVLTSRDFPVVDAEYTEDSIRWINPQWPVMLGEERFDSIAVKNNGSISFQAEDDFPDYPYKYPSAGEYNRREIFTLNGLWQGDEFSYKYAQNDSVVQIVTRKSNKIKACTQIYRNGKICIIYDKPAFDEGRIAGLKTGKASYFSGLEPIGLSDKPNAVWFMPVSDGGGIVLKESGEIQVADPTHVVNQYIPVMLEDADGNIAYKSVLLDVMPDTDNYFSIYPNPLSSESKLAAKFTTEGEAQMRIYTSTGQLVHSKTFYVQEGLHHYSMSALLRLKKGVYICKVNAGNDPQTTRFVVM